MKLHGTEAFLFLATLQSNYSLGIGEIRKKEIKKERNEHKSLLNTNVNSFAGIVSTIYWESKNCLSFGGRKNWSPPPPTTFLSFYGMGNLFSACIFYRSHSLNRTSWNHQHTYICTYTHDHTHLRDRKRDRRKKQDTRPSKTTTITLASHDDIRELASYRHCVFDDVVDDDDDDDVNRYLVYVCVCISSSPIPFYIDETWW